MMHQFTFFVDDMLAMDERGNLLHYGLDRSAPSLRGDRCRDKSGLGFSLVEAISSAQRPAPSEDSDFSSKYNNYSLSRRNVDAGVLSLGEITAIPNESKTSLHLGQFKDPYLVGMAVNKSAIETNCSILSTLSSDGKLSCRFISRESVPRIEALDEPSVGEICDYSHLVKNQEISAGECEELLPVAENFAPLRGVACYLDFYWDEQRAKIFPQ